MKFFLFINVIKSVLIPMIKRNGIHFYILKIFKLQNFKIMAKYGEKAQEKVAETMHEMKEGK